MHSKNQILTLLAQLNHPTDNNETFAVGAEYGYKRLLFARTGWEFGSDEAYTFPTAGLGIRLPRKFGDFRFDYSLVTKSRMGNSHRLSLLFNLR
jgi:hypothetical protein